MTSSRRNEGPRLIKRATRAQRARFDKSFDGRLAWGMLPCLIAMTFDEELTESVGCYRSAQAQREHVWKVGV